MGRKLVVVGGERPQMRKARERNWTDAQRAEFLSALAQTCNVTLACERAGISPTHAYRVRKSDASFRASWREAVGAAYQRLELVLLDRAFNGTEKLVLRKDGSEARMTEYSNQLGLALLKMHRDTAAEAEREFSPGEVEQLRERVLNKLKRLKRRHEQDKAEKE